MKTKIENPEGLHMRYHIQKINYNQQGKETLISVDNDAEYFILRLDDKGSDKKHIEACRKGVLAYADAIKDHLPQLSKELIEKYKI